MNEIIMEKPTMTKLKIVKLIMGILIMAKFNMLYIYN